MNGVWRNAMLTEGVALALVLLLFSIDIWRGLRYTITTMTILYYYMEHYDEALLFD